ncbi:DNA adenine methylase [Halorubrum aethiopicum]|uniref:DNA adenine methylase n=1 Tax=Halorubrum aethiopicum TaxID=1758255 RepID=UPI00082EB466|nr:DNA adenine methylase [Halorubrum aethiopicum]
MPDAVFPYPGGKSRFASWILEQVPEHVCFVEVFGGAAGVLANKDPDTSDVEVYNDRDGDLVQFFEVLRDRSEELIEWLDRTPYSRELHDEWAHKFFHGYRPSDPIERAGQFFYLRYTQWGGKYDGFAGLEGDWICSYEDLPECFEDVYVLDRDEKRFINSGKRGSAKDAKERLVMNFDPEKV